MRVIAVLVTSPAKVIAVEADLVYRRISAVFLDVVVLLQRYPGHVVEVEWLLFLDIEISLFLSVGEAEEEGRR